MFRKFKFIIFWILILALAAALVMLLWNALVPSLFGLVAISYWQALGLFVLCRILFGGFRFGGRHNRFGHMHDNPMREKWKNMTDEERKEFIRKRKQHWFGGGPSGRDSFSMDVSDEKKDD